MTPPENPLATASGFFFVLTKRIQAAIISAMDTRALIFAVWIKSKKSLADTILFFEQMAAGQLETYIQGGRTMVSTTIGSESFSYQFDGALSATQVAGMAFDAWRRLERFKDGDELRDWLLRDDVQMFRVGFRNIRDL